MYLTWRELADAIRRFLPPDELDCAATVKIQGHGYCCVSLEKRKVPDPLDGSAYFLAPEMD